MLIYLCATSYNTASIQWNLVTQYALCAFSPADVQLALGSDGHADFFGDSFFRAGGGNGGGIDLRARVRRLESFSAEGPSGESGRPEAPAMTKHHPMTQNQGRCPGEKKISQPLLIF